MSDSLNYDLVVCDDDCKAMGQNYKALADKFNTYLDTYTEILDRVINEGLVSGKVHNNFKKYSEAVTKLKGQINDLADKAQKCTEEFVTEMDEADSYIY